MPFSRSKKLVYTEDELYEYAVGALGRRMRTVAELKRLLRNKVEADTEFGKTLIELIIRRLKIAEQSDVFDRNENFNPFSFSSPDPADTLTSR